MGVYRPDMGNSRLIAPAFFMSGSDTHGSVGWKSHRYEAGQQDQDNFVFKEEQELWQHRRK